MGIQPRLVCPVSAGYAATRSCVPDSGGAIMGAGRTWILFIVYCILLPEVPVLQPDTLMMALPHSKES